MLLGSSLCRGLRDVQIATLLDEIATHEKAKITFYRGTVWVQRSFQQLRDDILAMRDSLVRRGLKARLAVGLVVSNSYDWLVTELALVTSGALVVPLTGAVIPEGGWESVGPDPKYWTV